jgi:nicotinamide riboside kinase
VSTTLSLPVRVVLTGSECTGKSWLAARLAQHFQAPCTLEYARTYAEHHRALTIRDVRPIADGQALVLREYLADAARAGRPLLLHDTDLLSTVAYSHHYYGECPPDVEQLATDLLATHYLCCDIDVPWIADGVRDRGDRREEVHALFVHTLSRFGAPFTLVHGSWDERFATAVNAIDALLPPDLHSPSLPT